MDSGNKRREGRRNFLKIMGASLALAGLSACTKQPTEYITPYVEAPEQSVPGNRFLRHGVSGGRHRQSGSNRSPRIPTDEGGRKSGASRQYGRDGCCRRRLRSLVYTTRPAADGQLHRRSPVVLVVPAKRSSMRWRSSRAKTGSGIRILTETVTSPTLYGQIQDVLKLYPGAKWYQWEPTGHGRRMGAQMAFGDFLNPVYKFDQADVVLAVDSNFLGNGPGGVRYARDFVSKRHLRGGNTTQSRYYAVETTPTATGCKADHRQAIKPSEVAGFVRSLAASLGGGTASGPLANSKFYSALVKDLLAAKGKSIVIAGEDQSPEVHAVVHYINQVLGNNGTTVVFTQSLEAKPADQWADLTALLADLHGGQVDSAGDSGR